MKLFLMVQSWQATGKKMLLGRSKDGRKTGVRDLSKKITVII
jgi:hypothetical protein